MVKELLEPLPGVSSVGVNQVSRTAVVSHVPSLTSPEALVAALNGARLGAALVQSNAKRRGAGGDQGGGGARACSGRVAYAAALAAGWLGALLARSDGASAGPLSHLVALATVGVGLAPLVRGAARSLRRGAVSMDAMMLVAVLGSCAGGQFLDAALVVALVAAAGLVEDSAMERVQTTLDELLAELGEVRYIRW